MPEALLYKTYERAYYIDVDRKTFRKVEISENVNSRGHRTTPWMSKERLANEKAALDFIANNTTIRVPKIYSLDHADGCLSLTMEYIPGKCLDELPWNIRPAAVTKANQYITEIVLPQLSNIRSKRNGSLTGHIIPPRRVNERFPDRSWTCKAAPEKCYVFCHNDLGQHNVLCDPKTGDVLAVIDWEYSGYYDPKFEAQFWLLPYDQIVHEEEEILNLEKRLR